MWTIHNKINIENLAEYKNGVEVNVHLSERQIA